MMAQHGNDEELSVIVTGGASGIGAAVAELVLERGGCVGMLDLDVGKANALVASSQGRCVALQGKCSGSSGINRYMAQVFRAACRAD